MRRLACALAATTIAIAAHAQEPTAPTWELRAEAEHDNLDHGQPDWKEELVQLAWKPKQGLAIFGAARATERFNLRDREGYGGAYVPLTPSLNLHVEASVSETHHVLARHATLAELSYKLGDGWVGSLAAKAARYETGNVHTAIGTVEKYAGDWRFAYTGYLSRPESGPWGASHRLSATWSRGTLTYASGSIGFGREIENVIPAGLLITDVRSATLGGGIEVVRNLGLGIELGYVHQGDLYTRRYARLGARYLF